MFIKNFVIDEVQVCWREFPGMIVDVNVGMNVDVGMSVAVDVGTSVAVNVGMNVVVIVDVGMNEGTSVGTNNCDWLHHGLDKADGSD